MSNQDQNQYQSRINGTSSINGTSPAGGTGGQQAGYAFPYQTGASIPSYEVYNQTAPPTFPTGHQPQTDQNGGSGGHGASR